MLVEAESCKSLPVHQNGASPLALTATAAAEATDTPLPTATTTLTPTSTSTPAPTLTPTPPPGMAYVPDFIGMDLPDAEAIVIELGFRWFYVAVVNRDVPEWQVFEQSPDPGSLIDLDEERVRLFVAVDHFTPTPTEKPPEPPPPFPPPPPSPPPFPWPF